MAKAQKTARDSGNDPNEQGLESVKGGAGATEPLKLERLIHARMRLAIVSALAVNSALSFSELKAMLGATDGNLSVHARKLEDAGYIECTKSFQDRTPRTEYRLTDAGRQALDRYLEHMGALIRHTRHG
jgi:DNA-binding MarR family transcriptional regulator